VARLIQAGAGMFREPAIIETSRRATLAPSQQSLVPFAQALQTKPAERGAFAQTTFRLGRWAQLILYAQHVTALATKRQRWDGFASLSIIIGSRSTAALTYNNEEGETTGDVALQRALPFGPGWGYRVAATSDGQSQHNGYALVEGQSRMGYAAVRYDQTSATSQGTLSADVSGSVAMMHWRPLLARSLDTSFALVQVPNGGRVRIYANNQDVGRTNRWGDLLVTDLQPYHASTFTIRDEDIPVNYELNDTDLLAALPYRGGAVLRFAGHEVRAFRGRVLLRTASGDRPPAYGTLVVDVNGTRVESPVGSDGGFYLENLPAGRYQASVESESGNCAFEVRIPDTHQVLTDLDMIRCEPAGR
jgi:outer membrane usher protein